MHIGRQYSVNDFLAWTRKETQWLIGWALFATLFLHVSTLNFLTVPAPILTIVGAALAISLAFKSQQCFARCTNALTLSEQLNGSSFILAERLISATCELGDVPSGARLEDMFYRHFAWLTSLRFYLRDSRSWENRFDAGNIRFLAKIPSPESTSALDDELKNYLSDDEVQKIMACSGDKESLILDWQYEALRKLRKQNLISEYMFIGLIARLDDLSRLQGGLKLIKNYPYPRNYYSIAVILVKMFVAIIPFGLFPFAYELGKSAGIADWTAWLNVPFSVAVGWVFVSLEKVGENSSNPFEGNANDVPISSIARRIEIAMRGMMGESNDLQPIVAKSDILF
ncbi:bestrophin family ion channel [Phyllobacterium bourgognense]|uniref:Putative membrane protein n=1 Tax=Phyllobacterium bourgognense TaxID=314236 RepID=A0A368YQS8_9HYPH|nr:bestrophin family ion channel [Phyllobacterium bourgognense]RCW81928.1 putative membrane protein [Phyllobacterium bourgognense]